MSIPMRAVAKRALYFSVSFPRIRTYRLQGVKATVSHSERGQGRNVSATSAGYRVFRSRDANQRDRKSTESPPRICPRTHPAVQRRVVRGITSSQALKQAFPVIPEEISVLVELASIPPRVLSLPFSVWSLRKLSRAQGDQPQQAPVDV